MSRPIGSMNVLKRDAAEFARTILDDPEYKANVTRRAIDGTLAPQFEITIWYYRFGRPREFMYVGVEGEDDLAPLSDDELAERADRIARALRKLDEPT